MGLFGWILYFISSIILFFSVHYLEVRYLITKLERLVFSIIIWLVISQCFFHFAFPYTSDIFLIFVFLFIVDIFYHSYFLEDDFFDKNENNILYYILLIFVGFFLNQEFINKVNNLFLSGEELRVVLWLMLLLFLYRFSKEKNIFSGVRLGSNRGISSENILIQYTKFRYRYGRNIEFKNKDIADLVYSLMIFENHKRNKIFRVYDNFIFRITGSKRKMGIMQVDSDHFISDLESIQIVNEEIEHIYAKNSSLKGKKRIMVVMDGYCKENLEDIQYIFDLVQKF